MADERFEPKIYRVLSDLFAGQVAGRVETETSLPDYKEAAERIVRVQARARVTDKKLIMQNSGAVCEVEGVVSFHILYLPEGAGEMASPCAWPVQVNFSQSVKIPLSDESIDPDEVCIQVDLQTENVICKLLGPRKISLRCEVKQSLNLKGNRDLSCYEDFSEEDILSKKKEWNATRLVQVHREEIDLTESIALPGAYPAISEIVQMDVDLFCSRVKVSEGGIRFSGTSDLRCTYLSQTEENLVSFYQPVEFEKNIGIPLCTENCICRVLLTPTYLRATPDVNQEGETKEIHFEIGCSAEIFVFQTQTISAAEDVFSTKNRLLTERCEKTSEEIVKTMDFCVSQRATVPKGDAAFLRAEDVSSTAGFLHSYLEGQSIVLEGKADFSYLGYDQEEKIHSGHVSHDFKVNIPMDAGWDFSAQGENRIEIMGICRGADLALVGNEMEIRYEICGTLCVFARHTTSFLSHVETAEEIPPSQRGLLFYYPEKDEDLWQVCKKFHISPDRVYPEVEGERLPSVIRILQ